MKKLQKDHKGMFIISDNRYSHYCNAIWNDLFLDIEYHEEYYKTYKQDYTFLMLNVYRKKLNDKLLEEENFKQNPKYSWKEYGFAIYNNEIN